METCILYATPRAAIAALQEEAEAPFKTLRPYDRFNPETTFWWLVPAPADRPAYRYAKVHCDWGNDERTKLWLGLHLEKGLGAVVTQVYPCKGGRERVMTQDWAWSRLWAGLKDGSLAPLVAALAESLPMPLEVAFSAHYVQNPCDFDPQAPAMAWDRYQFYVDPTLALKLGESDACADIQVLEPLAKLTSWSELAGKLECVLSSKEAPWVWINFNLGVRVPIRDKSEAKQACRVWNAAEIWRSFLRPLVSWFVPL